MPNIPAYVPQDIIGVGSSERFSPTPLKAQFLAGGLAPYITQTPSLIILLLNVTIHHYHQMQVIDLF